MLDPASPNPRFYQLYAQLRDRIISGEFLPLQPIPSQQQLMEVYKVSLITVRRALERLTAEGYITREHGRGCFVAPSDGWLANRKQTTQIGVIVSNLPNSFFPEIIAGIEECLAGKAANLVIAHSRWEAAVEQAQIGHFLDQGCAGLIISPSQTPPDYQALARTGVPFVFINHYFPAPEFSYVVTDDWDGAQQAGRHLIELGHRRIGAIIGGRGKQTAQEREEGFLSALRAAGAAAGDDWLVRQETFTYEEGERGMRELLLRHPELTAVFCSSEILALGAASALFASGRRIPRDVSLAAFGDSDTSRYYQVPLTTVHQPTQEMGRRAMRLLWELIKDGEPRERQQRLPCRLVVRESTGGVRG